MRRSGALALAALLAAGAAHAQAAQRIQPTAFPATLTPFIGLGFGGTRTTTPASEQNTCPSVGCSTKLGAGPGIGVDFQLPIASTLGFGLSAIVSRPSRVECYDACESRDKITAVHGAAMLLWRFKARAPIYFGVGAGMTWMNHGVAPEQLDAVKEFGGAFVIGYDFALTPTIGGRVAWLNHLTKPSSDSLLPGEVASSLAWDKTLLFGVRVRIGK